MEVYNNFLLKDILFYKIGGMAKVVLKVENKEDLMQAFDYIQKNNVEKVMPIGLGSNLLMSDKEFDGAVLWFAKPQTSLIKHTPDGLITSFSSHLLDDVIQYSFEYNLVGLEWAGGLPSTVGGAIRGNIGCFGTEIKDIFYKAEVLDLSDRSYKEFLLSDCEFIYRNSIFKRNKNLIIVSGQFQLQKATEEELQKAREVYKSNVEYRNKNHPVEYPSCGSVFKNIVKKEEVEKIVSQWQDIQNLVKNKWHNKVAMGYVINRLGFSGFQIGGAQVSGKHANYIVNVGGARLDDVIAIIHKIQETFLETFSFPPELEVEIVR